MPKVYKKTARKDYPESGIKKGQTYWTWTFYRQRARKSPTPPTRSDLTQVEYRQTVFGVYDVQRDWSDLTREDVEDAIAQLEEAESMVQESYDNLPEQFQYGEQGSNLDEVISSISDAVSQLQTLAEEMGDEDFDRDTLEERFMDTEPDVEF